MADVDRFEDNRGIIQDILAGPIDSVTEIFTYKGAIRGNHVHYHTTQWTYVISGRLQVATPANVQSWGTLVSRAVHLMDYGPGDLVCDPPGVPHAWKALEDTKVLVFTRGPRSGASYESDVKRLDPEDWLIR